MRLMGSPAALHMLLFVSVFIALFCLERRFSPSSNWAALILIAWVIVKYAQHRRRLLVEEMEKRKKWYMSNTQPLTPLEPCEWLNKLLINTWPNYLEPKLSHKFASKMMKMFKSRKLKFIESIELEEFSLGLAPPAVGIQCTYWTMEENEHVLHTGFQWDTNEMSILMATNFGGPFKWRAFLAITSLHIKGDLLIFPILDGRCTLYSFESAPKLQVGVTFGIDSDAGRMIEIPGISFLLEKILLSVFLKKMIEPNRRCISFPVVDLQKHISGAILLVTIVSGIMLQTNSCILKHEPNINGTKEESIVEDIDDKNRLVEVKLGRVARKTRCSKKGDLSPTWNETFEMLLEGSTGSLYFDVLTQSPGCSSLLSLGQCRVKVMYAHDDSAVFWAIGRNNSSVAARCDLLGNFAELSVPLEQNMDAEIRMRLEVKEWKYEADDQVEISHGILGSLSSFKAITGRTIKVEVKEGRNIAGKDKNGNCDPYVLVQYGKILRRTKTIKRSIHPVWNQTFEFAEISGGEYLRIKCFDADWLIDEILGTARVSLEGLEGDKTRDVWVPLESINTGKIRLTIKAIESPSLESSKNEASANGILELVILEARDLVAADFSGTSDPFVSVHYGKLKKRTKVIYKNLNPQWNQTLEFPDDGKLLELHVKDHNVLLPTSNIGHCSVEYEHLPPNQMLDTWLPLLGVKRGEIHIQITRLFHHRESLPHFEPVNVKSLLTDTSSKIESCIKEAFQLSEDGEMQLLCEKISQIESLENSQEIHILQVLREKELLLAKISELERVMEDVVIADSELTGVSM